MKMFFTVVCFCCLFPLQALTVQSQAIIIDHNCTDITKLPVNYILGAKSLFRIAYGHTSHGSQIVSGMDLLRQKNDSLFAYNNGGGSLYLDDASVLSGDLGNPDRVIWEQITRDALNHNDQNLNMIMWSWCGQVNGSQSDIETYLDLMNKLESDFPSITFVYMTGHLDGSGVEGNVNLRNEQIRRFCKENKKILFDFADIESYDPDGNYFLDKGADDGCNYSGGNWADEWCQANPGKCNFQCECAHSKPLNCLLKGEAFWWMMARLSGWDGKVANVKEDKNSEIIVSPNPASEYIYLTGDSGSKVAFYNNLGIMVKSAEANSKVDISDLVSGVYQITIQKENKACKGRVIVVK